ncbi:(methyl)glyoxal oxidase [Sarracenia purpurea var. burkii]
MATLFKPLVLLSLLFVSGSAFPPFFNPPLFTDVINNDVGTANGGANTVVNGGGAANGDGDVDEPQVKKTLPIRNKADFETRFMGLWKIDNPNAGVSAMQIQLLPNNKAIMYDATSLGPSSIQLQPVGNCRPIPGKADQVDCWAHAVEYDVETAEVRTLKVLTDSWCSSGGLAADGTLVSTGGFLDGGVSVRLLSPCEGCDWKENPKGLVGSRWYATQQKLEDGRFVVFGGRREFSYEYVESSLNFPQKRIDLPFLRDTTDEFENNLYPFAFLLPDGTLFLLANNRSVIIDPKSDKIIRELPVLPGGSRNYPASGMAALLPLKISGDNPGAVDAEILVCGGAVSEAAKAMEKQKKMLPALQNCGRITVTKPDAKWEIDMMPTRRVMGDMQLLPTGDVLIINGAMDGVSGWNFADVPNLTPLLYNPDKKLGYRFKSLKATQIPRMYHASSAVLPDGQILVAGSNTNPSYMFNNVKYPTELRVEKFTPPYLDPLLDEHRPKISEDTSDKKLNYGAQFNVDIEVEDDGVAAEDLKVTMLAPPFTTHGFSQNQRLVVLEPVGFENGQLTVVAPPSGKIAPPGYYLLYVVHRRVPSRGMWVQIQ